MLRSPARTLRAWLLPALVIGAAACVEAPSFTRDLTSADAASAIGSADAGTDDAAESPELDATLDAARRDASQMGMPEDAAIPSEAAQPSDAAPLDAADAAPVDARADAAPPVDASGATSSYAQHLARRLTECNLLAQAGTVQGTFAFAEAHATCAGECLLAVSCNDLERYLCEAIEPTTQPWLRCVLACDVGEVVDCRDLRGEMVTVGVCDGYSDCRDGSDEVCPSSAFWSCSTDDGRRVASRSRCNAFVDCSDGSDERNCPPGSQFMCADGVLVHPSETCNGFAACNDGSDELSCAMFRCRNGQQVPEHVTCDLLVDCADGSDEEAGCMRLHCGPYDRNVP